MRCWACDRHRHMLRTRTHIHTHTHEREKRHRPVVSMTPRLGRRGEPTCLASSCLPTLLCLGVAFCEVCVVGWYVLAYLHQSIAAVSPHSHPDTNSFICLRPRVGMCACVCTHMMLRPRHCRSDAAKLITVIDCYLSSGTYMRLSNHVRPPSPPRKGHQSAVFRSVA